MSAGTGTGGRAATGGGTGRSADAGTGLPVISRVLPPVAERAAANARMVALLTGPEPGPVAEHLALLHFTGRRSGAAHTVPAGLHRVEGGLFVATGSPWRHNFAGGAPGEITWRGNRSPVRFTLVTDAERTARGYHELYERYGPEAAQRRLGITVDAAATPTPADFRAAVTGIPLALVAVDLLTASVTNERTSR
ncbi:hypothetical protein ACIG0A_10585 [Streptomyces californicus]|uniref:hypothetical protein n=1 Tax=Streptomyces californicus TaxID=67351 RepID=UPI0037D5B2ED